jgi:hypothetical protein
MLAGSEIGSIAKGSTLETQTLLEAAALLGFELLELELMLDALRKKLSASAAG